MKSCISIFIIFIYLYILPDILEGTARFIYSYLSYGHVNFILETGSTNPDVLPYQNWPGSMLFASQTILITNIMGVNFLMSYAIIMKSLFVFIVYTLIYILTNNKLISFYSILFYILADWSSYFSFTPPSMGLFLLIVIILIFLLYIKYNNKILKLLILPIMISLIITHLLSAIVAIICLISLIIIYNYLNNENYKTSIKGELPFILLILIIFTSWLFYPLNEFTVNNIQSYLNSIFNIFNVFSSTEKMITGVSENYKYILTLKYIYTGIFIFISLLGVLYIFRNKENWKNPIYIYPIVLIFVIIIITPLIIGPYNGEIISRVFGICSIFLAFFAVQLYNSKWIRPILLIVILIAPTGFIICAYGNEKIDYVSQKEISGVSYFYDVTDGDTQVICLEQRVWPFENLDKHQWIISNESKDYDPINLEINHIEYVSYSSRDNEMHQYLYGENNVTILTYQYNSNISNEIYSSGEYSFFYIG